MQLKEYQNIFQNEASHFFYVGTHKTTLEFLNRYLTAGKKINILDAGCGTGLLLKKINQFGKTWGVDVSSEALKFARKRNLKRLYLSSIMKLPFKKNEFDAVTCIDVLYHKKIQDTKALAEIYRVLKPGGILILKVPAYEWLRGHHDIVVATKHRYTKGEIQKKIENTDFKLLRITHANSYLLPLALMKRFLLNKILPGSPSSDVQKVPDFINRIFISLNILENKVLNYINLPFGLSIYAVCLKNKVKK